MDKKIMFYFVFGIFIFGILLLFVNLNFISATAWNITTATFNGDNLSVHSEESSPADISLDSAGNNLAVLGATNDTIFQYSLTTIWNISTGTYNGDKYNFSLEDTNSVGFWINSSWDNLLLSGYDSNAIFQYPFLTNGNISTIYYSGDNCDLSNQTGVPTDTYLSNNGSWLIVGKGNQLYQYGLRIAGNVSTCSYTGNNFSVSGLFGGSLGGIDFSLNEDKMFLMDTISDIHEYNLSDISNISNAVWTGGEQLISGNPHSMYFKRDGTRVYATQNGYDAIAQYEIPDDSTPNVTINSPSNITYLGYSIDFNITAIDDIFIDSCWVTIDGGVSNLTLTNITYVDDYNATNSSVQAGSYKAEFYCNDSANNVNNTETINFVMNDTTFPELTIIYPLNNSNLSSATFDLNYTYIEINPDKCWYSNDSGITNSSYITVGTNWTAITGTEGNINRTIYCNDTANNLNSSIVFFTIDITNPSLTINQPTGTIASKSGNVNITITDTNLEYCYFNVTRGVATEIANTQINLINYTEPFTVSGDANYIAHVACNDSAGNENYTTKSFIVDTSGDGSSGGGGGGDTSTVSKIAIKQPLNVTKQNDLERAILFSRIYELCGNYPDVIGGCILNLEKKEELLMVLSEQGVDIDLGELNIWIKDFNKMFLEEVQVTKLEATRYNLFIGVLKEGSIFKVDPFRIDPFSFFILSENPKFKIFVTSNRVLKNVSVISGGMELSAVMVSDTTTEVTLEPINIDFSSKIFQGRINYIDEKGDSVFQDVNIRVINLRNPLVILELIIIISMIIISIFFRKKIKKITKKIRKKISDSYRKIFKR